VRHLCLIPYFCLGPVVASTLFKFQNRHCSGAGAIHMKTMSSGAGAMFMKEVLRSRSCIIFTTAPQPEGSKLKHLALELLPPIKVLKVVEVVSVHKF